MKTLLLIIVTLSSPSVYGQHKEKEDLMEEFIFLLDALINAMESLITKLNQAEKEQNRPLEETNWEDITSISFIPPLKENATYEVSPPISPTVMTSLETTILPKDIQEDPTSRKPIIKTSYIMETNSLETFNTNPTREINFTEVFKSYSDTTASKPFEEKTTTQVQPVINMTSEDSFTEISALYEEGTFLYIKEKAMTTTPIPPSYESKDISSEETNAEILPKEFLNVTNYTDDVISLFSTTSTTNIINTTLLTEEKDTNTTTFVESETATSGTIVANEIGSKESQTETINSVQPNLNLCPNCSLIVRRAVPEALTKMPQIFEVLENILATNNISRATNDRLKEVIGYINTLVKEFQEDPSDAVREFQESGLNITRLNHIIKKATVAKQKLQKAKASFERHPEIYMLYGLIGTIGVLMIFLLICLLFMLRKIDGVKRIYPSQVLGNTLSEKRPKRSSQFGERIISNDSTMMRFQRPYENSRNDWCSLSTYARPRRSLENGYYDCESSLPRWQNPLADHQHSFERQPTLIPDFHISSDTDFQRPKATLQRYDPITLVPLP